MDLEKGSRNELAPKLVVCETEIPRNINGSWNKSNNMQNSSDSSTSVRLLTAKNIQRPQLTFKDKIDNSHKPWQPKITYKHNLLKPLALYVEDDEHGEVFNHPYEFELDQFEPSSEQLTKKEPELYKTLEETPIILVENENDLKSLLEDLRKYKEIAVDLEHHSYRTFLGITCLMQISTRDTDYIVDTLKLRSELHELNEIFTHPKVLKVFHGAENDVQWLQRDLSLYVVNMFDTNKACKQLALPHESLAYLLKTYCSVNPDKSFQLVDWRVRPLSEDHLKYARSDTHYLLYIKDVLRNALIDQANGQTNILKAVYSRSTEVCKIRYEKPIWREDSYMLLYRKSRKMFNNRQMYAFKELFKWRDAVAREQDDSLNYVMPDHVLINIAQTLPKEMQGILACCGQIPPLVRQYLLQLHKMVLKAISQPLIKPVLEEEERQRMTQRSLNVNNGIWNYSPHDIPSDMEPRADLPCLLSSDAGKKECQKVESKDRHDITVWDGLSSEDENTSKTKVTKKKIFLSPYQRYRKVIPLVVELEAKERARQEKEEEKRLKEIEAEQNLTKQSIDRVKEHFHKVACKVEKPVQLKVTVGEIAGRKRKKRIADEEEEAQKDEFNEMYSDDEDRDDANSGYKNSQTENTTSSEKYPVNEDERPKWKGMKKNDKKRLREEMESKGCLPSKKFNYQTVDFSSFQGGSKNGTTETKFEQKKLKEKQKRKNRKKSKIAGI